MVSCHELLECVQSDVLTHLHRARGSHIRLSSVLRESAVSREDRIPATKTSQGAEKTAESATDIL